MRPTALVLFAMTLSTTATAEDTPVAVDWRMEQPGWGFGLRYGTNGPSAVLRGWSNAALSMDIEGGLSRNTTTASGSLGDYASDHLSGRLGVAPRVRIIGTKHTDILFVPSLSAEFGYYINEDYKHSDTAITATAGVAVDRWFSPGVSFTGRIDAAQVTFRTHEREGLRDASRSTRVNLTPSVAIHVYPTGLRKRQTP
ncbi:MAG: hypothetical protein AB8H79_19665 [Myxococcota bacterium]